MFFNCIYSKNAYFFGEIYIHIKNDPTFDRQGRSV